jgi:hypothetical protein
MKTNHRARADFLRDLRTLTTQLYDLGDFTSTNPDRALLEKKIEGFIEAGLLIEVAARSDMQEIIDECHLKAFSETREERKKRLSSDRAKSTDPACEEPDTPNWGKYDSPTFDRVKDRPL